MTGLVLNIPIRTGGGPNSLAREHWAERARRVKRERGAVHLVWRQTASRVRLAFPLEVKLCRLKPRGKRLDDDNLRGSLKAIRDQVATELGVDDADSSVTWAYAQATGPWGVRIEIQTVAAPSPDFPARQT